ncbi:MAG: carbohydrate kinase family protein [Azospirillaceae bacterium]
MTGTIACFGAAHVDYKAQALAGVTMGSSNPVRVAESFGGVARNVAETLARLDVPVSMVSRVGDDPPGDNVVAELNARGIDTEQISRSTTSRTASYTALMEPTGEMAVAMADMGIYDEITPGVLAPAMQQLHDRTLWFVDTNLPTAALQRLLAPRHPRPLVAVDTVSVAKSAKLRGLMGGIDILFVNKGEAAFLSGIELRAPLDVSEAANRLRAQGAGAVVISLGSEGGFVASDGVYDFFPALGARVKDVTGAGDALVAGVLYGQLRGSKLDDCMRLGIACAAMTVESTASVSPTLTTAQILRRAGLTPA